MFPNAAEPSAGMVQAGAPEIVAGLLRQAEQSGASDVHLHVGDERALVHFRLDGQLAEVLSLPRAIAERVAGRIKFLARLKTYDASMPQDGRIPRDEGGTRQDVRVATYPTVTGEKIVLRLFPTEDLRRLDELQLGAETQSRLESLLRKNTGMLLLTGPAGSGKTTTIYGCLRKLAEERGRHVITVEDPVEQVVEGIMQTEVNEARGLTFARAARHLLRQDPQVLVIGEIRDDETAQIAVRAAWTGHLVMSTMHAGSCRGVVERLFLMCPDRYVVAGALSLILNQRLARKLCAACGGGGCDECYSTGYRGRVPVVEWLEVDEAMRGRLIDSGTEALRAQGTLEDSGNEWIRKGITDAKEIRRVCG